MHINGVQWDTSTCTYSTCLWHHSLPTTPPTLPSPTECCPILSQPLTFLYTIDTHSTACRVQCIWGTLCHFRVLRSPSGWCHIPALLLPCGYVTLWRPVSLQPMCAVRWFPTHGPIWKGVSHPAHGVRSVSSVCVVMRCSRAASIWKLPWLVTKMCACFPEAAVCSFPRSPLPHSPHDFLRLSFIEAHSSSKVKTVRFPMIWTPQSDSITWSYLL